ncbi:helix-turn-helix domain-containing protein [Nanoarchaeota archaeon]
MGQADILEQLFDGKILSILRVFYRDPGQQLYLREISKKTHVPVASTFRIIQKLVKLNIITQHVIKKFKLYNLGDNESTRFLGQLIKKEKQALQVFITRAKGVLGVETIMLQGREEKDRANLIIIGQEVDKTQIKNICANIKKEFNFTITELVLEKDQYQQMNKMGLYPGQRN